jgi:hypothetical protein
MRISGVRILDLDGSLLRQEELIARFSPAVVDLRALESQARLWFSGNSEKLIRAALDPQRMHAVTFFGSGDYHQISGLLAEQFDSPLTLIVFDHHPDFDVLPPKRHCGSWISEALKLPHIRKIILLGIASSDISTGALQTGNLAALKDDRLEIYPYRHESSRVFLKKVPVCSSVRVRGGFFSKTLVWTELCGRTPEAWFADWSGRVTTEQVYISIDKDCLKPEAALTNWEGGSFRLDELLSCLKLIGSRYNIAGMDVTGEYSFPQVRGAIKTFAERCERPSDFTARGISEGRIDGINQATNLRILEAVLPASG